MAQNGEMSLVEQTAADLAEYGQLQLDKLKLRLLDDFATLFNNIFGVLLVVILASLALVCLAIALTWGLGALIGSYLWAVVIMGGVFILAAVIVYALRRRLVINSAVKMLAKLFFEPDKQMQEDEDYE